MTRTVLGVLIAAVALTACKHGNDQACREARAEMNQHNRALGGAVGPASEIPEEPFMSQCRGLPAEEAQCLIPSWHDARRAVCDRYDDHARPRGR